MTIRGLVEQLLERADALERENAQLRRKLAAVAELVAGETQAETTTETRADVEPRARSPRTETAPRKKRGKGEARKAVVAYLEEHGETRSVVLSEATGISSGLFGIYAANGHIERVAYGVYGPIKERKARKARKKKAAPAPEPEPTTTPSQAVEETDPRVATWVLEACSKPRTLVQIVADSGATLVEAEATVKALVASGDLRELRDRGQGGRYTVSYVRAQRDAA